MKLHILGICGTFMAGIAVLAKALGHDVTGSDANVYPPMSTQLEAKGIRLFSGYFADNLNLKPDLVIVGNAISRGNPELEAVLNEKLSYVSGPQWLFENVLKDRHVLAVAGTHGKTTASSMLAWVLEFAGKKPGFLIGGVPENFEVSARLGDAPYFVIEADEYDSAFFDKRSKFIHYHPNTLILNNLEFDHADIFSNLEEIKKQFHHLIRTIPAKGCIVSNKQEEHLNDVLAQGCWTPIESFNDEKSWHAKLVSKDGSCFDVYRGKDLQGQLNWPMIGLHNVNNAIAVIAASVQIGIEPKVAIEALSEFKSIKRRMELKFQVNGVNVYDDFAHHPTAIKTTLEGLRRHVGEDRILAVLELGSYTMRSGYHKPETFDDALIGADKVFLKHSLDWKDDNIAHSKSYEATEKLVNDLIKDAKPRDHILIMSNTGFDDIFGKLEKALQES
jgi:UDP-N-acetylmuramate: L-alanyl-gamma-D-glutamyl-meso-diaminopimelate ligase